MIRLAKEADAEKYAKWLIASSDINLVDPATVEYPTAVTFVSEDRQGPALMNTIHAVTVMEALAPRPGLTPMQEARALKDLFDAVKRGAANSGHKEIMFGCADERVHKFIEGRGFERLKFPIFRFKL